MVPWCRSWRNVLIWVLLLLVAAVSLRLVALVQWIGVGKESPWNANSLTKNATSPRTISLTMDQQVARSTEYLPLFPWERQSIVNEKNRRTCRPPRGIPDYCCLGSLSEGGVVAFEARRCRQDASVYQHVEQLALEVMVPLAPNNSNDTLCDWCRMIDILLEYNWTMALQGDSITRQMFAAVECELRRRNLYEVTLYQTYAATQPKPRWRYGLDEILELHVTSLHAAVTPTQTAIVRYYAMYRPLEDRSDILHYVLAQHNDVLLLDHGLHYGTDDGDDLFVTDMRRLFATLSRQSWKLLAWRETSAQHFDAPGGHYYYGVDETCVPLNVSQSTTVGDLVDDPDNRHATLMRRVGAELNLNVTRLPWRAYTSQLHALHDVHTPGDCSHYCYTPFVWLPLYRLWRMALDEAVVRHTVSTVHGP